MDAAVLAAAISAGVALLGTGFTFVTRHRESYDKHIDMAFTFNQELVEDLRTERADLRTEREQLMTRLGQLEQEVSRLHGQVEDQRREVERLRQSEAELREWATHIMQWAVEAVEIIRDLGGVVGEPPAPPPKVGGTEFMESREPAADKLAP